MATGPTLGLLATSDVISCSLVSSQCLLMLVRAVVRTTGRCGGIPCSEISAGPPLRLSLPSCAGDYTRWTRRHSKSRVAVSV